MLQSMDYLSDGNDYGIDWDGPVNADGEDTIVVPEFIEEFRNPLVSENLREQLQSLSDNKIVNHLVTRDNKPFLPLILFKK